MRRWVVGVGVGVALVGEHTSVLVLASLLALPQIVPVLGRSPEPSWRQNGPAAVASAGDEGVRKAPAEVPAPLPEAAPASESGDHPLPTRSEEALARASRLGLGTQEAANALMRHGPPRPWVEAVVGERTEAYAWPVPEGRLFRGFGNVRTRHRELPHKGIDVGGTLGTQIVSVADGLVGYSDVQPGYGLTVLVIHRDGRVAVYAHLRSSQVVPGELIRAGQPIGEVGETGITLCPHLHLELRERGEPRDPLPYLRRGLIRDSVAG